ncbi:MAG: restriction endonuclease [Acidobacteria bacterium]|nr:restriction endonuclease [Acidobacteriota bacterium]
MTLSSDFKSHLRKAVRHFWKTRAAQSRRQGTKSGTRDAGARAAVTGGRQMDGFVNMIRGILIDAGLREQDVHCSTDMELPGWYRSEKRWDLLVVVDGQLLAAAEFKSQVGLFGNNFNNRSEEAIGNAADIWAAYREGAFKPSSRPWPGYLMLIEEASGSTRPVKVVEPHFKVFPEFVESSYVQRYEILLTKLMRERLYDSTCLLLSTSTDGPNGHYRESNPELVFAKFAASLLARARSVVKD